MSGYVDPLAVTRTLGPDPLAVDPTSLQVAAPPKFDPNNPLGLTAAAPGYLPPELRTPKRDPDLGWSAGDSYMPTGLGQPDLSVDERNALNKAQIDWANMDEAYWKPREQNPLPLVLGAAGLIAAPFALSALGLGGAAGAAGGAGSAAGAAGAAGGAGLASGATAGALGAGALGAGAGTTVSELVVTAAAQGLSIPAIATAVGIPAATVTSILSNSGGSNALQGSQGGDTLSTTPAPAEVDPITVTGPASTPSFAGPVAATLGGAGVLGALSGGGGGGPPINATPGPDITPPSTVSTGPLTTPPAATFSNAPPSLLQAIKSGDLSSVGDWIKANPLQAVQLGLLSASALSTVAGGGTSGSTASGVYHPVTLPATFSATSPRFALAGRGDPRLMPSQDWTKYGLGPEQSFFTGVDQPAPITDLTVRVPDRIHPKPVHFAHGGFAVRGDGDGRSDSIDAKLSDGEYVMDAETVALLGNGSNKAGADKLDQFRVNLRRDKGRKLARGEFSVHAKDPMAYAQGGR